MSAMKNYLWDLAEEFVTLEFQPFDIERHCRMVAIAKEVEGVEGFTELVEMVEGEHICRFLAERGF